MPKEPVSTSWNNIRIPLQPKQGQLLELCENNIHTRIGLLGSRGATKSYTARMALVSLLLKNAGTTGLMLRKTYGELYDNHIEPLFDDYPFMRQSYSVDHKTVTFPQGSRLKFGYAEHAKDMADFFGKEYTYVVPEEAALFEPESLVKLEGSCRCKIPGVLPKMIYPFMPGGPAHDLLVRWFLKRDFRGDEDGSLYAAIRMFGWDNIEWFRKQLAEDGISEHTFYYKWSNDDRRMYYITRTPTGRMYASIGDPQLRAAWLDGNFEIHDGNVFPELSQDIHDLDLYTGGKELDTSRFKLIASLDHATTGVTAAVELALDWDGNMMAVAEYYERNKTIDQHAEQIINMLGLHGSKNKVNAQRAHGQEYILIDPSTEAKTLQHKTPWGQWELSSVIDEYSRHGISCQPAYRSEIGVGLGVIKTLLRTDPAHKNPFTGKMGSPRLFISQKLCPELWRETRDLQKIRQPNGTWQFIGSDHALDNLRYMVMSRPRAADKPPEDISHLPFQEQVAIRHHENWAKGFGGKKSNQWFGGISR